MILKILLPASTTTTTKMLVTLSEWASCDNANVSYCKLPISEEEVKCSSARVSLWMHMKNAYLWNVTCLGLTCLFFTSTLLPQSTMGMFSQTLPRRQSLSAAWHESNLQHVALPTLPKIPKAHTCRDPDAMLAHSCRLAGTSHQT